MEIHKRSQSWRFIPKRVFQWLATFALIVCVSLAVVSVSLRVWPVTWLSDQLGEGKTAAIVILTFLIWFFVWLISTLLLRYLSQMPTYKEELAEAGAKNFKDIYQQQRRKMHLDKEIDELPPQQRAIRLRWIAFGGLLLALICGITTAIYFLITGDLRPRLAAFTITFLGAGIWFALKSNSKP